MNEVIMEIEGHEIKIKRDLTVKKEWYYCVLGLSKTKVIYSSSPDIVYRKCVRSFEKGEVSFEPHRKTNSKAREGLPF